MSWFKRKKEGITTSTSEKKETPEGLWIHCSNCKTLYTTDDFAKNNFVCDRCSNHERISADDYFHIIFDKSEFTELDADLTSGDPLEFEDTKKYTDRLVATKKSTGLKDAVRTAKGKLDGMDFVIAAMDFSFIGGSMGSVMGEKIARAIDDFNKHQLVDVMIVGRGGGSLEDLFCFNERVVADAIFRSNIPIISACGHETDFTIADFCADVRAPTPSSAAELVVVDKLLVQNQLNRLKESISKGAFTHLKNCKTALHKIASCRAFASPYSMLSIFIQNVDHITQNIDKSMVRSTQIRRSFIKEKRKTLLLFSPMAKIKALKEKIEAIKEHLFSVNPNNLVKKGYCLLFKDQTKQLITSLSQLQAHDKVQIKVRDGEALATIENLKEISL
jgi:exodeoxyribonuclease VII large subunit